MNAKNPTNNMNVFSLKRAKATSIGSTDFNESKINTVIPKMLPYFRQALNVPGFLEPYVRGSSNPNIDDNKIEKHIEPDKYEITNNKQTSMALTF
jgi:hypothetical protein